jgi:hypothetical protein
MSVQTLRQDAVDALTHAGIAAYGFVPGRANPPLVAVSPGAPYLQMVTDGGKTFAGRYEVRLDIQLIAGMGTNEKTTLDLDSLIISVLNTLCVEEDWDLEQVNEPQEYIVNGTGGYLGTTITIKNRLEVN